MHSILIWVFLLFSTVSLIKADTLIQVHALWRHGDRTPVGCYPTDPYLSYWNQYPTGELTTIGMDDHYVQGEKMRKRYTEDFPILNKTYTRQPIYIRSSDSPRCLQSAASHFSSFYSESKETYPQREGWPTKWTPMPIHTIPMSQDHLLEPSGFNCLRTDELYGTRATDPLFLAFTVEHEPMIATIVQNSGYSDLDAVGVAKFYDCVQIEKEFRNWTLPPWITDELYKKLKNYQQRLTDFEYGAADFGRGENVEVIMLRGGSLLKEITDHMSAATTVIPEIKYYAYSAHDVTISALLRTLGAKNQIIPKVNPSYAAIVALELWKGNSGYYIKMFYSADKSSPFRPVTQFISGCTHDETCPFDIFASRNRPYLPSDVVAQCQAVKP